LLLLILEWITPADGVRRRLRMFVVGALAIAGVGLGVSLLEHVSAGLSAGLLRFYWFRLSDVAVPLSVALVGARYLVHALETGRPRAKWALAVAVLIAALHVGGYAFLRMTPTVPRADRMHDYEAKEYQVAEYAQWREACSWVVESGEIPAGARFLTPRMGQTFKWYAGRSEVVTWKDVPQDARSIVRWWDEMLDVHATGSPQQGYRWNGSLAELGAERLQFLGEKYETDYVLTVRWPQVWLPVVFENQWFVIYQLRDPDSP
ncbi:MAG: DUF6798 domain-containing protein, partial [Planctomycetota bacterium]